MPGPGKAQSEVGFSAWTALVQPGGIRVKAHQAFTISKTSWHHRHRLTESSRHPHYTGTMGAPLYRGELRQREETRFGLQTSETCTLNLLVQGCPDSTPPAPHPFPLKHQDRKSQVLFRDSPGWKLTIFVRTAENLQRREVGQVSPGEGEQAPSGGS